MSIVNRIRPGDTVVLHYRLTSRDGAEIESTFDGQPARITIGAGELPPTLEHQIAQTPINTRFVYLLEPEQAFGRHDDTLVQSVPLADFPDGTVPQPNSLVEFTLPNGTSLTGMVLERQDDSVKVDFNHPLVDCPVNFEVEILEVITPG